LRAGVIVIADGHCQLMTGVHWSRTCVHLSLADVLCTGGPAAAAAAVAVGTMA